MALAMCIFLSNLNNGFALIALNNNSERYSIKNNEVRWLTHQFPCNLDEFNHHSSVCLWLCVSDIQVAGK